MNDSSPTIGEIVRKIELDYTNGTTQQSKYVSHSMHETIETVKAYLNYRHISGSTDALGREKPFFNISVGAANIWFRATDIDRKDIRIRANKSTSWLDSFAATVKLRDWMRRERFGVYLNEWGRTLARFGSAVTKVVENSSGLHISVVPWGRIICDAVNFYGNPKVELIELTESELRDRVVTHGYREEAVEQLVMAQAEARKTLDKRRKDNKTEYFRLYEVHLKGPKWHLAKTMEERERMKALKRQRHVQQMHVISFVGTKKGRTMEYEDFTLYAGQEKKDPYRIAHLIPEDDRTLAMGAVEHLFQTQWQVNHSKKAIRDTLDLSSKLFFQTADPSLVSRNVLTDMEIGDIIIHALGAPMTQVNNAKPDVMQWETYALSWKTAGNEIVGISEAMLGAAPKSGTAWRQTEALLSESYSLFEVMTENKALSLEDLLREDVIPWIKKDLDTTEEITALLADHEINRIDPIFIKRKARTRAIRKGLIDPLLKGGPMGGVPTQEGFIEAEIQAATDLQGELSALGSQRFFIPSELDDRTWKEQFKDLEWEVEIDITGEAQNVQEALTTLNTALRLMVTPGFEQNKRAQAVVGRILELAGAMSPVEYASLPSSPVSTPQTGPPEAQPVGPLTEQPTQ